MTELFKPNELISIVSEMALSRTARHLFNYFLQHAQVLIKFENFKGNTFEINYRDLNELACINHKNNKLISKVLDTLMKPVTLVDDPKHIIKVVPIYEVNVDIDKGVYRYKLADTIIELLRQTDYFTKLKLLEMNPLESKHSLVIYEFLKRYENAEKIPKITIDELRQITDTQSKYSNFTDFERFVLKVAEKEINDKTNYQMTYDTFKTRTGRRPKVSEIQFYFAKKERLELENTHECEFNDELFLNFRQIFKNLPIDDYCHACDTFERSTLVRFYNDLKRKDYGTLKTECFLRYLNERTEKKWNGYLFKSYKKTPKEEDPGHASGSFVGNEKFNFDDYLEKERKKFFDV